ncbi:type VI secretion system transmembrane protein TssO [Aureivirga marina]|uniref:type VI secretion system transmembrane protein TssO n=1 Tax=Aureivirga marina TaxID=1182451 RepID=UPI0021D0559E|nr:type VI secretion system transmembrane protein TssO [Aureivirga marina]
MKTLNQISEIFWKKIKFIMVFTLSVCLIYIVITKFIFKVPITDNQELLESIKQHETLLEDQQMHIQKIKDIREQIKNMDFQIHQVQTEDDIKRAIFQIRSIYKDNKMNSKYLFSIQSSNLLQMYFDTREQHSSLQKNKEIILNNLNECKANI